MVRKRFTPEQIINLLREAEVYVSQGMTVAEACLTCLLWCCGWGEGVYMYKSFFQTLWKHLGPIFSLQVG